MGFVNVRLSELGLYYGFLATDWVRGWVRTVLLLSVIVMVPAGGPLVAKESSHCL